MPKLQMCIRDLFYQGQHYTCAPELLPLLPSWKIPANLLSFLAVVLRTWLPRVPGKAGGPRSHEAGEAWISGSTFLTAILNTCVRANETAYSHACSDVIDQLQCAGSESIPGRCALPRAPTDKDVIPLCCKLVYSGPQCHHRLLTSSWQARLAKTTKLQALSPCSDCKHMPEIVNPCRSIVHSCTLALPGAVISFFFGD